MNITQVGNRGVLFTFADETSVYLINTGKRLILCDTHCGPESMEVVKEYIATHGLEQKKLVIFNTHSDWDHIWGNCAFPDAVIIGSEQCRARMQEKGPWDLVKVPQKLGKVELAFPNVTFTNRLSFAEEGIELIYTPGHTVCSAICYDQQEGVVFLGDLVEFPVPYVLYYDVARFIDSLEFVQSLSAKVLISAHSGIVETQLLEENIAYLKKVLAKEPVELPEDYQILHDFNQKNAMILYYEKIAREKMGKAFDFIVFTVGFWGTLGVKEEELGMVFRRITGTPVAVLEEALQKYITSL